MKRTAILLMVLGIILSTSVVFAEVPRVISYQGVLLGSNEQPVPEGDYKITFKIYDETSTLLWTEVHNHVFVGGGLFQVILGEVSPLNIPFDKPYLLGIQVGNDPELHPRMLLTSAAYAIRAEDADKILGISASHTPEPEKLLPLDSYGKFPSSVLPGGGPSGNYLKKDEPETSVGTSTSPILVVSNLGDGDGLNGRGVNGRGVEGRSDNNNGVQGWTGASDKSGMFGHSTNGVGVTGRSDLNYGVLARSENSHSIYVPGAAFDGVHINSADRFGVHVNSAKGDGVSVNSAGRDAFAVHTAMYDGLFVESVNGNGVQIKEAGGNGVQIKEAGHDGLRVVKAGMNGLRIYENVAGNYIYAGSNADADFRVANDGSAYSDGGWKGAADFAELIEADGHVASYEPGDVMVISNDKDRAVTLSSQPYSTAIIGVYSTKPGFVGSTHPMEDKYHNEIPVAITGIVPCKVCAENGPIHRGDLLTNSSTPGYAMKATDPKVGTILGKAMGSQESGRGMIEILVILQ